MGPLCSSMQHKVSSSEYINEVSYFNVFKMAMKLYRGGGDYAKLHDSLKHQSMHHCIYKSSCGRSHSYSRGENTSSCIIKGCLLLRTEVTFTISYQQDGLFSYGRNGAFQICPNLSIVMELATEKEGRLRQCNFCLTEYRIRAKEFKDLWYSNRLAIIVTRWKDLGECRFHLDKKWLRHVEERIMRPRSRNENDLIVSSDLYVLLFGQAAA